MVKVLSQRIRFSDTDDNQKMSVKAYSDNLKFLAKSGYTGDFI